MFSVIIPNYNHAAYLKQRIDSVLNQTYQEFEVIILDDCSTDNSRDIIEDFKHHPKVVHIIINKENSGSTFKQWKKGIEAAKGDWVWIAESDDWCEPTFLAEMFDLIAAYPSTYIAYCQSLLIKQHLICQQTKSEFLVQSVPGRDWIAAHMLGVCNLVNASMAVFRRDAFVEAGDSFASFKQCGDWKLWTEMAAQGSVAISGKYLNYFRLHDFNTTSGLWSEGYYYSEGSNLFQDLLCRHSFSDTEIAAGLKKFYGLLHSNKQLFAEEKYRMLEQQVRHINPRIFGMVKKDLARSRTKASVKAMLHKMTSL